MTSAPKMPGIPFELNGIMMRAVFWDENIGSISDSGTIFIDTETSKIIGNETPDIALMTAYSNGNIAYAIHSNDIATFTNIHSNCEWVFHNVAFDFWVLYKHFVRSRDQKGLSNLLSLVTRNKLHDTMILDCLYRIATHGDQGDCNINRNLAVLAEEYAGIHDINKSDPYRLRYKEIIGKPLKNIEPGFITYAVKDVAVLKPIWDNLYPKALDISRRYENLFLDGARDKYGVLTEFIQIKGAIALSRVQQLGLSVSVEKQIKQIELLIQERDALFKNIREMTVGKSLFKMDNEGKAVITDCGNYSLNKSVLDEIYKEEHAKCIACNPDLPPLETNDRGVTDKADFWQLFAPYSKIIDMLFELREKEKQIPMARTFLPAIGEAKCRPHYSLLTKSGRVSSSNPNLHQVPREGGHRESIVPTTGYTFDVIDYSCIELCALAAICHRLIGFSKLRDDVLMKGIDPHAYTAALIVGMSYEDFISLKKSDPKRYKNDRQKAKAFGFGLPGGLGNTNFISYAYKNYGVKLTPQEVQELREKYYEIYPEIKIYLERDLSGARDLMDVLARNMHCNASSLWGLLDTRRPNWLPFVIRKIVSGNPVDKNGRPYDKSFVEKIWSALSTCCRNPEIKPLIQNKEVGGRLAHLLFSTVSTTLTGRVRSRVEHNQSKNGPFQGLAADGAKLALFRLVMSGFRVCGFIHDEFIIEIPTSVNYSDVGNSIEKIVCDSMAEVFGDTVPVKAEWAITSCWSKEAKLEYDEKGNIVPWVSKKKPGGS